MMSEATWNQGKLINLFKDKHIIESLEFLEVFAC